MASFLCALVPSNANLAMVLSEILPLWHELLGVSSAVKTQVVSVVQYFLFWKIHSVILSAACCCLRNLGASIRGTDWLKFSPLGYKTQTDDLWAADLQIAVLGTPRQWINKQLISGHTQMLYLVRAHVLIVINTVFLFLHSNMVKSASWKSELAIYKLHKTANN